MNLLPRAAEAVISLRKLHDYVLNPEHQTGKHKARVFAAVLGMTQEDSQWLKSEISKGILSHKAQRAEPTPFGERYTVEFPLSKNGNTALLRTAWMIRNEEEVPRLTSCYLLT